MLTSWSWHQKVGNSVTSYYWVWIDENRKMNGMITLKPYKLLSGDTFFLAHYRGLEKAGSKRRTKSMCFTLFGGVRRLERFRKVSEDPDVRLGVFVQ